MGVEGGSVGIGKGPEVFGHDGLPAVVCGLGEGAHLGFRDVFAFHYTAAGASGLHRNHDEVRLEPAEDGLVLAGLDLFGPEAVVVPVAAEARDADANGVLGATYYSVGPLGVVLEAEDQFGQRFGVHVGQLVGPDLADHVAGAGTEAATLADLEGGLQAYGDGPAGGVLRDVGLVNPGAGKVQARGDLRRYFL